MESLDASRANLAPSQLANAIDAQDAHEKSSDHPDPTSSSPTSRRHRRCECDALYNGEYMAAGAGPFAFPFDNDI